MTEEEKAISLIMASDRIKNVIREDLEKNVLYQVNAEVIDIVVPHMHVAGGTLDKAKSVVMKAIKLVPPDVWASLGEQLGQIITQFLQKKLNDILTRTASVKTVTRGLTKTIAIRLKEEGVRDPEKVARALTAATRKAVLSSSLPSLVSKSSAIRNHHSDLVMYRKVRT